MALTLLKMQQHKHHTVFRSVTSRALPREPCRAAAARALSRVAKAYSEMPATPHVPPADHIAVPLPPPPSPPRPFPSPFPRAREEARAGRGGRRGGAQDAFADTLCYYFNTIIRKVQARPRQPPPRPHPLRPPQLSCMLLLLRPSHLRRRFGSSRIRFLCAVVGG
jgi:hypothetical protein